MFDHSSIVLLGALLAGGAALANLIPDPREEYHRAIAENSIYDFVVCDIDGKPVPLSRYRGHVLLVVNCATLAPNAAQFISLQSLQNKFGERGFRILAFPSHSFGKEPRTDGDIKQTMLSRYKATFDLFAKVSVLGKEQCPLYAYLSSHDKHHQLGGIVDNDFTKFVIGKDGRPVARFMAPQDPLTPEVVQAIERALQA